MMQHLVRRDVVQNDADSLGGVQPVWHRNQFTLRQADELRGGVSGWMPSRHDVAQGDACSQHSHPYFAILRLGALFFNHPKCIGSAVVSDDDPCVSHERPFPPGSASDYAQQTSGAVTTVAWLGTVNQYAM